VRMTECSSPVAFLCGEDHADPESPRLLSAGQSMPLATLRILDSEGRPLPPVDVWTEPLPKSAAGKILKRDLRAPFWKGEERQVH
jgi:acyl-coenzyme A synthetase/AMP-(fatty) acid ligase